MIDAAIGICGVDVEGSAASRSRFPATVEFSGVHVLRLLQ
jgi:hypothetical protein